MTATLETTGERMVEEGYRSTLAGQAIFLMHVASYEFVVDFCRGKRVLDLGCGSGYGAAIISEVAASVHAVDVSADAIRFATQTYGRENITYSEIVSDAPLAFRDKEFDVVLSFQVLEHVHDDAAYLAEAARVLAPAGVMVLITPDRRHRLLPGQRPWNRWHLREYGQDNLSTLVRRSFTIEQFLFMEADPEVGSIELRRYRLLKWATLPFTFPGCPEWLRQRGLAILHRFKGSDGAKNGPAADPSLGTSSIRFVPFAPRSLNLLVVARPLTVADRAS
jgi:SAM-dependent methyltransferase